MVLWAIFGIVHSFFAAGKVKRYVMERMRGNARYYRLGYSLVAAAMIAGVLWFNFHIATRFLWHPSIAEIVVSGVAGMSGLVVMGICIRKYFFELSGISAFFDKQPDHHFLEVSGLNRYVRHPLYAGTLLFTWSFFLAEPSLANLISAICITLYTLIGTYFEERKLLKDFGNDYRKYAERVPMIIPRIG